MDTFKTLERELGVPARFWAARDRVLIGLQSIEDAALELGLSTEEFEHALAGAWDSPGMTGLE